MGYNSTAEDGSGLFTLERNSTKLKDQNCDTVKLKKKEMENIRKNIRQILLRDNVGGYTPLNF